MTILIRGMEMPNNGEVIVIHSDGYAERYSRVDISFIDFPISSPCKVVKVPPHGRLIDADALIELYEPAPAGVNEWEWERYKTTVGVIRQNIKDAPTVIEAEDE